MANGLPLIVWVHDETGQQVVVNDTFCEYFGVTREEMQGGRWQVLMHPDDARAYAEEFAACLREQRPFHAEVRVKRRDGQWRWIESWARPRYNEAGQFRGMLGTSADINERKQSEAALERATQRLADQHAQLQAVYGALDDGVLVFDNGGRVILANPAEARLLGYQRPEDLHQPLAYFIQHYELFAPSGAPLPEHQWPLVRVLRGEHTGPIELATRRRDTGESWLISYTCVPVRDHLGQQILSVVVSRDVTEARHNDRARQLAAEQARFRAALADAVRPLASATEIKAQASRVLGEHLRASRVFYMELVDGGAEGLVEADYHDGVPSVAGRYRLDDYNPTLMSDARAGMVLAISEVATDPRLNAEQRRATARLGVGAYAVVPLVKQERPVGLLVIHYREPHVFSSSELALAEEVAEQTWSSVERARAEVALRQSEERYRKLFESIDQGFCVIEVLFDADRSPVDYRFLETNPAFERHTGLERAVGKTARSLVPNLEHHWLEAYGQVALTGQPQRFTQGSEAMGRWFEVVASRVGEPPEHKVALLFTDISERKRADDELRQAHALIEGITGGTEDQIAAADLDFCYTYVNEAYSQEFLRLWRRKVEIGASTIHLLSPWPEEQQKMKALWSRALAGESFRTEMELGPSPGERHVYDLRFNPIRDLRGNVVGAAHILRDVTERVQVQRALAKSEERLRESDRRKDEYLAMLGHELRNPLAAIQNATDLIRLLTVDDPRVHRAAGVLARQSAHMASLIDGLLEVSRIARGKVELNKVPVDVRVACQAVIEDRNAELTARDLELRTHFPGEALWVCADPVRLAQILDNLIGNALKFTKPPGRIDVEVMRENATALVKVFDTGIGIRPERLGQIFEPFYQEGQDVARGSGGLGLGLALAKGLVELHGGSIEARSEGPGAGAAFLVRLPLSERAPAKLPRAQPTSTTPRRILVVEDNVDAAEMLRDLLQAAGHQVGLAGTADRALAMLRGERWDLVLCDIGLPGMSGYEFARAVRADDGLRATRLVALTGYGQPEDRARTASAGFDAHLTKPVDLHTLQQVVETAISG